MNELALFAGAGGGILGGHLLGWRTVCAVEWEPYPASVLCARQNDGLLPPFPVWDDVQTFDGKPWRGIVDVVSGGFPCQDISAAGKGAGIDGERSGMWREMARIIYEVRPKFVFVENSPMLTSRGLGRVLGDLAEMGFDANWGVLGAANVGAPHKRDRIWIVGKNTNTTSTRLERQQWEKFEGNGVRPPDPCKDVGNTNNDGQIATKIRKSIAQRSNTSSARPKQASQFTRPSEQYAELADTDSKPKYGEPNSSSNNKLAEQQGKETGNLDGGGGRKNVEHTSSGRYEQQEKQVCPRGNCSQHTSWWAVEPNVGRVADGVAARVDRLKAIGNGQVSEVARRAWESLSDL
jgi:DNA (cytosine-5)-methyltransferase 1